MSIVNRGLVPLSKMNGYVDDRLAFGLTLPEYVPTDQIGLNVSRLQQLTRLGGLGLALRLVIVQPTKPK